MEYYCYILAGANQPLISNLAWVQKRLRELVGDE